MKLFEIKVEYHDTLNSKIWDDMTLKSEVRKKLLEIVDTFMKFADFNVAISDIVFIGSLTNYNWTPQSDIDLHIIVNMDTFKKACPALAGEDGFSLFKDKSTLFNEHHSIKIYGFPVEVVIEGEDDDKKQESATVYSVKSNKWLKKPVYSPPDIDTKIVQQQADKWKKEIDKLVKTVNDPEEFDELKDELTDTRRAGIKKGGEFDEKNIAYKELRKSGHLAKLKQAKRDKESEQLSLDESELAKI